MKRVSALFAGAVVFMLLAGCTKEIRPVALSNTSIVLTAQALALTPRTTTVSAFQVGTPVPLATWMPVLTGTRVGAQAAVSALAATSTAQVRAYMSAVGTYQARVRAYATSVVATTQALHGAIATPPARAKAEGAPGVISQYFPPRFMPGPMPGLTYVVHTGDTFYSIARRFGVTVEALAAANGIWDIWHLEVGQVLVIPAAGLLPAPEPVTHMYIVQPGDTLYSIARRFCVPVEELAAANGILDLHRIFVGQQLIIPRPMPPSLPPVFETPLPPLPPFPEFTPFPPPFPTVEPFPTFYPPVTETPVSPGMYQYSSMEGKFSVQYPQNWQNGTQTLDDVIIFWARQSDDQFSPGMVVMSKPSGAWRPARDVLDDYKGRLDSLMSSLMTGATFAWDNNVEGVTWAGELAVKDYGYAQLGSLNVTRLWGQAIYSNNRDYFLMVWAPPDDWPSQEGLLATLMNSFQFLP